MARAAVLRDIVLDYGSGRASVQDFLNACRSYCGPAPHLLFSDYAREDVGVVPGPVFFLCLDTEHVPEERLFVFLKALIAESPQVLTLTHHRRWGGLLHIALWGARGATSLRVILLLANRDNTRLWNNQESRQTPLHVACQTQVVDPDVIHRLVDLDPDVLTFTDGEGRTPLHYALEGTAAGRANLPELVCAVLHAHPTSLVISDRRPYGDPLRRWKEKFPWLPYEAAEAHFDSPRQRNVGTPELLRDETVRMALAVVEYALGVSASAVAKRDDTIDATAANVGWFQGHVKDVIQALVPGVPVEGASGLSVAQALLRRRAVNHPIGNGTMLLAVVNAVFCHDRALELLRGDIRQLRSVVLCETVVDLYRLNQHGRYRPNGWDANVDVIVYDASEAAALHQIELLASLQNSGTVESTYLQFREVAQYPLLHWWKQGHESRDRRVG